MPVGGYYTSFQVQKETIRLNFAMTINKTQGQTIPNIGIYLSEPMFSHRQLYVALSRGVSRETTWFLSRPNKDIDPTGKRAKNIVYTYVLEDVRFLVINHQFRILKF